MSWWGAAFRVLAITLAVLSLAGRTVAAPTTTTATTRTITRAAAELRAVVAIERSVERANDATPHDRFARDVPLASTGGAPSWILGAGVLAGELDWRPSSRDSHAHTPEIVRLARGPPPPHH